MDLALVERLIELVGRSPIRELELSQDGWRLRLAKAVPVQAAAAQGEPTAPAAAAAAANSSSTPEAHVITAGTAGTFYRGPAPDKPPFVAVGDAVQEGQTLGLLEAMKTLIPIESDRVGHVVAILCDDGSAIRTGDPLFSIEPAEPA